MGSLFSSADGPEQELAHVRTALLQHYGIEASEIALLVAGSTPNLEAKDAVTGMRFLVKALRSRLGDWVAENACKVTAIAAHVSSLGVPTPAPVKATDGALVVKETGPRDGEETNFVVLEWAEGYQRADNLIGAEPDKANEVLRKLGGILAGLHSLATPTGVTLTAPDAAGEHALCDMGTFLEHSTNPDSLFEGQTGDDAKWFRSWLPRLTKFWKTMPGPAVLCHGDAYLDNVLVKADGSTLELMLVDWEDACATNPVVDLAACAVGTCFTLCLGEGSKDVAVELVQDRLAALVSGYAERRPLSTEEMALLRPSMQACAWACGAFRYGRYLEGVSDLKTVKYGQLIEVVKILEDLGSDFDARAFRNTKKR